MEKRVKKIFDNITKKPDVILIKNSAMPFIDDNFFYVTGLTHGIFEGSFAVLFPDGKIELVVPQLEEESAKKTNANINVFRNQKDLNNILKNLFSSYENIGLNFKGISLRDFLKIKNMFSNFDFFDISDSIEKTRLVKDEIELKFIREACRIVDIVAEKIPQIVNDGMYEYQLAAEIVYLMQKNGADKSAFETISSFGKNSAEPHYTHGNIKLKKGDFVLCDFGACFKKYNSDITRTFIFDKSSEMQKEMYKVVLEAHKIGFNTIKSGIKASEVHNAVLSYIQGTKFKDRFIHSTGHSLGISVHDSSARFSSNSDIIMEENMVFTVEPGVYIPGLGGVRIEDDVLVKGDGAEFLTNSSRDLIEI
ncbi:MAG: aminopeptidase P family protein [Thermoplasmatales archaeon]|nr:MAG: aminopeptidase P family protein [Thermoplasmatales archaeon]